MQHRPATLVRINADIPQAVAIVLGAEPRVRTLLPRWTLGLANPPKPAVESHRQTALGAWYAHLGSDPTEVGLLCTGASRAGDTAAAKLLKATDAHADAELVDATVVARTSEGSGTSTRRTISSRSPRSSARAGT